MELRIVGQQRLDRFTNDIFLVSPPAVSTNHLAKLSAVVTQVIDSNGIISQKIIDFVNGISDHGASNMSDMERFRNVRRRIFHDHLFPLSHIASAVIVSFFDHFRNYFLCHFLPREEHVYICIDVFYFFKNRLRSDRLCQSLCDHLWCLAEDLCQLEAWERIISHLAVSRCLQHVQDLILFQPIYMWRQDLCNFFFIADHSPSPSSMLLISILQRSRHHRLHDSFLCGSP